ncbi:MAG: hypothetical protein A2X23_02145 [Chloroflexi bacterium GWC2_73_18]|nr:MAG: hypothetical protein A2X23_02145 [Chloroflexi bacterium GWC2_73_18]
MRRTLAVAMAAVLALGLAFAAPAAAAPTNNPFVYHYAVTCGGSSFEVIALDITGWEVNSHGTPSLLMGGEYTLYEGGQWQFTFYAPPPPGLTSKLVECDIVGPLETDEFQWVIEGLVLFTPQS